MSHQRRRAVHPPAVGDGKDHALPSISAVFDDTTAPGLSAAARLRARAAFVEIDYRRPRNARHGGWYRVEFSHYDDRDRQRYTFNRFDVDLRQFVSILSERRVFVAPRRSSRPRTPPSGQTMPFYLMPSLGGNDTLRGFRDYRFRGPHALLLQAEYRFEIWSGLDAALFYDAGKVAMERSGPRLQRISRRTTASASASTPTTASSSASTPPSAAATASTSTSSSAACSRCGCAPCRALVARRGAGHGARSAPRRRHARLLSRRSALGRRRHGARCLDGVDEHEDTNGYDFVVNTFGKPGERRDVRAMNVNTLDEVPDSSWFTNRIGRRAMPIDELVRGPDRRRRDLARRLDVSAARAPACSRASG